MKLTGTEKILGIVLLILWIVLFTAVIESVAEVIPTEGWVVTRLYRDYGWIGNVKRNRLLNEYMALRKIVDRVKTELKAAIENKNAERTKALIATCARLEIAIRDFLDRSETFIKTNKGI